MAAGVEALARVLARTYGPQATPVVLGDGAGRPELVADAGVLARRMTGLADRRLNAGAMALREACIGVRRRYGDGAATVAVLAQALVGQTTRLVVGGADPVLVRRGVDHGVAVGSAALAAAATPVTGAAALARLALGAGLDPAAAAVLGEVCDTLGDRAGLILEERDGRAIQSDFVQGIQSDFVQGIEGTSSTAHAGGRRRRSPIRSPSARPTR